MQKWILVVVAIAVPHSVLADDSKSARKEFVSKVGGFAVAFPGEPTEDKVPDEKGGPLQIQFTVGAADGAYLMSYQDNPKLVEASKETIANALVTAQNGAVKSLGGKLTRSKEITLAKEHPGRDYEFEFNQGMPGVFRSRAYLVKGRLYQVIVVGKKEFATGAGATQFLDSFRLQK